MLRYTIQSDRETWLVDVAATPLLEGVGASARTDGVHYVQPAPR